MVLHPLHARQHKAGADLVGHKALSLPVQIGDLMARIDIGKVSGGQIQDPFKGGDEQPLAVGLAQKLVDLGKHLAQVLSRLGVVLDQGLSDDHEQGRRNALSGDVRHHHCQMTLIHHKEIVKVAAHLSGGIHGSIDVELQPVRKGREDTGQHGGLDVTRHVQLRADALLFRRHRRQVPDVFVDLRLHLLDGFRKVLDLVSRGDMQAGNGGFCIASVLLSVGYEGFRRLGQHVYRRDDGPVYRSDHGGDHHAGRRCQDACQPEQKFSAVCRHLIHGNVHVGVGDEPALAVQDRSGRAAEPPVIFIICNISRELPDALLHQGTDPGLQVVAGSHKAGPRL